MSEYASEPDGVMSKTQAGNAGRRAQWRLRSLCGRCVSALWGREVCLEGNGEVRDAQDSKSLRSGGCAD